MTEHLAAAGANLDLTALRARYNPSVAPPTGALKWYDLSCHCGAIQVSIELPPLYAEDAEVFPVSVMNDNCTICTKNGYLLTYPDVEKGIKW